jgi:hypothetical protein
MAESPNITPNEQVEAKNQSRPSDQVGLRVSLIPEEEINRKDPVVGFRKFVVASSIGILLMGALAGGLWFWVSLSEKQVAVINAKTTGYEKQAGYLAGPVAAAQMVQVRLKAISSLLAAHRTGLAVFDFFEAHTLPKVAFSSVSIDDEAGVNLAASAGSYEDYAGQIDELRKQYQIKSLVASGVSPIYDDKGVLKQVDFSLALQFDPMVLSLLYKQTMDFLKANPKFLEKYNVTSTPFSKIMVDGNGGIRLTAVAASNNFTDAQIEEFRKDPAKFADAQLGEFLKDQTKNKKETTLIFKSVTASGITPVYGDDGSLKEVDFSVALTIEPEVFDPEYQLK